MKLDSFIRRNSASASTPKRYQHILDCAVMIGLTGLISWFFRRSDPAWIEMNPSPWLIVPLLIGFRYGFWKGVVAGVVAAFVSALLTCYPNIGNIPALIAENAVHYGSYLAAAGLAGFAGYIFSDTAPQLEAEVTHLKEDLERKDAKLVLLRENELQLKQALLLHNAEYVSLADDLVNAFTADDDQQATMELASLLYRNFGVLSGAIYVESPSGVLNRYAAVNDSEGEMPDDMKVADDEMVSLSIKKNKLVTCRDLWDSKAKASDSPWLAVVPIGNSTAMLLIRRMKLENISWDSFGRMEAVMNYWLGGRGLRSKPIGSKEFSKVVDSAIELRDDFGVPACVVHFEGKGKFASHVSRMATPGYYSKIGSTICVIVMEGKKGARAFAEKVAGTFEGNGRIRYDITALEALLQGSDTK